MKYTDPDGKFTFTNYCIPDLCSINKSAQQYLGIPVGGGYTSTQNSIAKLNGFIGILFGAMDSSNGLASTMASMLDGKGLDAEKVKNLVTCIAGIVSETAGTYSSIVDFASAVSQNLSFDSNEYSTEQKSAMIQCGIEQAFVKDLSKALTNKGIANELNSEQGSGFIQNISVFTDDMDEVMNIANDVKNNNCLYKDISIKGEF